MPKKVDHQKRRTEIANALIRVAAEAGLEAVSLRHVAAEAGVSAGMVQHYFRSKDEMMLFALEAVHTGVRSRLQDQSDKQRPARRQSGQQPARCDRTQRDPAGELRALFVQLLPLDQTRRMETRVALGFLAYAAVHPEVAVALEQDSRQLESFVAGRLREAWADGRGPDVDRPDVERAGADRAGVDRPDPEQTAVALLALVDGLGVRVIAENCPAELALSILDAELERLFRPAPT